ncbi:hypothetical protein [Vreelandella sedimenti]|uniref:hypothetical protein n=1 Tax=Vreelandella sedimenti TaxID=2729618 RepID=UPI00257C7E85|nr:hypothetical protein [Halomonas sp. UBA3173]|tara:strand:+ start:1756 stop:1947 length:192 start_codon:yes stop_codon:yes gene_type:complete
MPSKGGRYVIRNGSRELVHRTKPTPTTYAKAPDPTPAATPVKTETAAPKPAKAAAKQEVKGNE